MILYRKLFSLMKQKELTTYRLRKEKLISEGTLTSLRSGDNVSTSTIDAFCRLLNCQPGDLMEYVADEDTPWESVNIETGEFSPSGFTLDE